MYPSDATLFKQIFEHNLGKINWNNKYIFAQKNAHVGMILLIPITVDGGLT